MGRPKKETEDPAIDVNEANALFTSGAEGSSAPEDQQPEDQQPEDQQPEFPGEITAEDEAKLKAHAELDFRSNGKSRHMPEGEVYRTSSDQIRILLLRGFGEIAD